MPRLPIVNFAAVTNTRNVSIVAVTNGSKVNLLEVSSKSANSVDESSGPTNAPSDNQEQTQVRLLSTTGSGLATDEQDLKALLRLVDLKDVNGVPEESHGKDHNESKLLLAASGEAKDIQLWEVGTGTGAESASGLKRLFHRDLVKKAAAISIEHDGTTLVSDKVGDLSAYPFIDDSRLSQEEIETKQAARAKYTAIELSADPSMNPDAKIVLGHVSHLTSHLVTKENADKRRYIISADRDEHIRVSRYPNAYNIERYLLGHESFVASICVPAEHPNILLSAGGDPFMCVWDWTTGQLLRKIDVAAAIKPYRRVRTPLRMSPLAKRLRKRARSPSRSESAGPSGTTAPAESNSEGTQPEEMDFDHAPDGWMLPINSGVCINKIAVKSGKVIFMSLGAAAIFSIELDALLKPDANPTISNALVTPVATPAPVLDFVCVESLPGLLVSTDPAWTGRVDGGRAKFIPHTEGSKKAQLDENANNTGLHYLKLETRVLSQPEWVNSIFHSQDEVDSSALVEVPLYGDLSLLARWPFTDDPAGDENVPQIDPSSGKLSNQAKRAAGRLRAQGVDIRIEPTAGERQRKAEQQKAKKKAKREKRRVTKESRLKQELGVEDEEAINEIEEEAKLLPVGVAEGETAAET